MAVEETTCGNTWPKTLHATNKVKFFCSHGGMILPRPCDGHLKYVGGETRVISAPRNIFFSDLMRKINNMFEGDFVIKYQIGAEELEALVSVKSNEDLCYMLDEYDRLERGGTSKLRTFLFPSKPSVSECHSPSNFTPLQSLEQRYVDALNGIVRSTNNHNHFASAKRSMSSSSRLKSMCSSPSECSTPCSLSPRSVPHSASSTNADNASFIDNLHGKLNNMTRVHSSPSLCGLDNEINHLGYHGGHQSNHHQHQQQQQLQLQLSGYNNHVGRAHEHPDATPWMSSMRDDYGRVQVISNHPPTIPTSNHCHPFHKGGSGGHNRWAHLGQYTSVYGGISNRSTCNHNESRGIMWE